VLFAGFLIFLIMLVNINKSHINDIFDYSSDKDFQLYLGDNKSYRYADAEDFVLMLIDQNLSGKRVYFAIEIGGKIVGTAGFLNISLDDMSAELGYGISKVFWGSGILMSHVREILVIGFSKLNFEKVYVGMKFSNYRSISFAKKLGAIETKATDNRKWFQISRSLYENCNN